MGIWFEDYFWSYIIERMFSYLYSLFDQPGSILYFLPLIFLLALTFMMALAKKAGFIGVFRPRQFLPGSTPGLIVLGIGMPFVGAFGLWKLAWDPTSTILYLSVIILGIFSLVIGILQVFEIGHRPK